MRTFFKVSVALAVILTVTVHGVIAQDPFGITDPDVQPSVVTAINNFLEPNGDDSHDNEPRNYGNETFNSTRLHDNTTDNYSNKLGNDSTVNETNVPLYYETTTEKFDEKDLIFVNETSGEQTVDPGDDGSGEMDATTAVYDPPEAETTMTTEMPRPTKVMSMSGTSHSQQDTPAHAPTPAPTPTPIPTSTTNADTIVNCHEEQCRSWYGDNYDPVPYFNAQDGVQCLNGCHPPQGAIICHIYWCVKWYSNQIPYKRYEKDAFSCEGCYPPNTVTNTTTTTINTKTTSTAATTRKPATTTTQGVTVIPPVTPTLPPEPTPSPPPLPTVKIECNIVQCTLWYGSQVSWHPDSSCPRGVGCIAPPTNGSTTEATTQSLTTTTVTTTKFEPENVTESVPPVIVKTTTGAVIVDPQQTGDDEGIFQNIGVLVGIAAGAFLLLVVIAAILVYVRRKGKKNHPSKYPASPPSKQDIDHKTYNGHMYPSNGKVYHDSEDSDLIQNPAYGKQKQRYSKKSDRGDSKESRYNKPRDEPFYDKAQSAKAPPSGYPNRRPSDGDRYVDFPEGPKPGSNDMKLYNNPAYEKKKKKSSKRRKDEEDADLENYYTYPKHLHAENKYEKRPPLPSDKGKIKSGKEKIKKKSKDKKKKQKLDPSLYGEAFHNRAFEGDDPSGTVKSDASGIYESIRIPDPNYQSLERKNAAADKNGTAHSNHGYLSIDRKQGKSDQTNFDALRFQPGVIDSKSNVNAMTSSTMSNDGYLEPATLRREDKNKSKGDDPDSRLKTPQANPLYQRMNSDDTDTYDKPMALRQDSGYHSQKPSQRSQKSSFHPKESSRSKAGSMNSYSGYYPGDKRSAVFDPRNPNQYADPYGSGAAVFQASDLQQNPLYQGSTGDVRSGGSRSGTRSSRSHKTPKDLACSGSRFGDLKEEQSMYMDLPADPNALYDRVDGHRKHDPVDDLYDRADGLLASSSDKKLRRYDNDLNVIYDKADGARIKSAKSAQFDDLNDRADSYKTPTSDVNMNIDIDDLYDRADGLKNVNYKRANSDLDGLYDRADNVAPSSGGKKRLPRQPMPSHHYDGNSRHNYIKVIP